jgi:hypothetical protein
MLPFLFFIFLVVWLLTTFKRTDPISFVSVLNPLHFRSESAIRYICFWIRIRSLSAPLRIRWKHIVEDKVKAKSDPIWSVYIPTLKDANTAKALAEKAAKTAEAKAKKAEKALAEVAQKQTNREGAIIERLDAICTSVAVSSSSCLYVLLKLYLLTCFSWLTCISVMQQSNLERSRKFGLKVPKTICWTRLTCWSQTGGLFETSFSELAMLFLACSSGYSRKRRTRCPPVILGN